MITLILVSCGAGAATAFFTSRGIRWLIRTTQGDWTQDAIDQSTATATAEFDRGLQQAALKREEVEQLGAAIDRYYDWVKSGQPMLPHQVQAEHLKEARLHRGIRSSKLSPAGEKFYAQQLQVQQLQVQHLKDEARLEAKRVHGYWYCLHCGGATHGVLGTDRAHETCQWCETMQGPL